MRIHECHRVFLFSGVLICGAAISVAQTETTPGSSNPGQAIPGTSGVSPFAGSVPAKLVPGVIPLSLQDAISKQLGLKLVKQKRPIPVLVIDHIDEKPTEN